MFLSLSSICQRTLPHKLGVEKNLTTTIAIEIGSLDLGKARSPTEGEPFNRVSIEALFKTILAFSLKEQL
jgi:hypothetical protein